MTKPKAFLFDLNGTMIDDMQYHIRAWSDLLNNDLHAGLSYEQVKAQMYGSNDELLIRVFGKGHFTQKQMRELSLEKERRYQQAFLPELKLIAGLEEFLNMAAEKNIQMAIGSAALRLNIDFVLDNLPIRHFFQAIVSASDVQVSKPHPETYLRAAGLLKVDPSSCMVFEDAPKGVESAANAGMQSIVLTTMHGREDFTSYPNILSFIENYHYPGLQALF